MGDEVAGAGGGGAAGVGVIAGQEGAGGVAGGGAAAGGAAAGGVGGGGEEWHPILIQGEARDGFADAMQAYRSLRCLLDKSYQTDVTALFGLRNVQRAVSHVQAEQRYVRAVFNVWSVLEEAEAGGEDQDQQQPIKDMFHRGVIVHLNDARSRLCAAWLDLPLSNFRNRMSDEVFRLACLLQRFIKNTHLINHKQTNHPPLLDQVMH